VRGGEHYADALTDMACAGAPLTDPRNGRVMGIVDLSARATNANALMVPFAKRAAWEIEQRLLEGVSAIERVLHERFLHARRRAKGPLALVSEYVMMTNTAAARMLEPADQPPLWERASRMIATGKPRPWSAELARGAAVVEDCEPVDDGGIVVGALIRLRARGAVAAGAELTASADRPTFGWASLTESERGVAELVAEGLTNREVAVRLFLSPHTIDAHLRHIFRKLDIDSRVELARIVAEHGEELVPAS
jgi:DNA-binding CsgD family transcriptional regulator